EEFLARYELTPAIILERVYKKPFPNRFLASLSPFLVEHLDVPEIHTLVLNGFKAFFDRNVKQYDYKQYPVHLIGSLAFYYRSVLQEAAEQTGVRLGTIKQSPMEGLISYHSN
ncbi:MAG: ATPase, partial [Tannerellaceae bacterium]|nr:ATPase [Tannerellaceae bacterium]